MSWVQLQQPKLDTCEMPGYCLGFVTKVYFGNQGGYGCATDAWNASGTQNGSRDLPDASVPVWFSWFGNIDGTYKDWGHVVAYVPGRGFLSSPGKWSDGWGQQWFGSIEEIERWFGCRYVGWTQDVPPVGAVVAWSDDAQPAPSPSPDQRTYTVVPGDTLWGIAVQFYHDGTRYPEIAAANGVENPNLIFPGQVFIIP